MLVMMTGVAVAGDVVWAPKDCTIENTKFSSGGGDSAFFYMEVFCTYPDGRQVLYLDQKVSIGGIFGIGRVTMPSDIEIIKTDKVINEIKFK